MVCLRLLSINYCYVCMCVSLCVCLPNVPKGGASSCVVKNGWITMESGSEESPECMLHMKIHTFSVRSFR